MTVQWMRLGMQAATALVLLGTMALSACETPSRAPTGLYDPSSDNSESVPYDAWFKDRPQ
jgi:hypothetical protein